MGKRLDPEKIEKIRSMSEKKIEQIVIAEALGIAVPTVRRYQKEMGINASNRYNGGMLSRSIDDEPVSFRKAEQRNGGEREKQPRERCLIAEKVYTLTGIDTGYMYTFCTQTNHVKITTNNKEDIVIDLKNLVVFGNEILDVAESFFQKMKENRFGI